MDGKKVTQKLDWLWLAMGTVYMFYIGFAFVMTLASGGLMGLIQYLFMSIFIVLPVPFLFLPPVIKRSSKLKITAVVAPILIIFALLSSPVYSHVFYQDHLTYAKSQFEYPASVAEHKVLLKETSKNWYKYVDEENGGIGRTTQAPWLWHQWVTDRVHAFSYDILVPENTTDEQLQDILNKYVRENLDRYHHRVIGVSVHFHTAAEGYKYEDISPSAPGENEARLWNYISKLDSRKFYFWEPESKSSKGYKDYKLSFWY
jgi:hypothetical protein